MRAFLSRILPVCLRASLGSSLRLAVRQYITRLISVSSGAAATVAAAPLFCPPERQTLSF